MCLSAMEMTSFSENACGWCDYDTVQCYCSPTEVQNFCCFERQPYGKTIPTLNIDVCLVWVKHLEVCAQHGQAVLVRRYSAQLGAVVCFVMHTATGPR